MLWSDFNPGLDSNLSDAIETAFKQWNVSTLFEGFGELWRSSTPSFQRALTAKLAYEEGYHSVLNRAENIFTLEEVSQVSIGVRVQAFSRDGYDFLRRSKLSCKGFNLHRFCVEGDSVMVSDSAKVSMFLIWLGLFNGTLAAAINVAIDHVKTRNQFARPVGSFQLVQEHLVDCYLGYEHLKGALEIIVFDNSINHELLMRNVFRFVCRKFEGVDRLIQAVGGIGFTQEFPLGDRFKSLVALADVIRE